MENILLIVDMQEGFINEYTQNTKNNINKLLSTVTFDTIISSKFVNTKDSPCVIIANWCDMFEKPDTNLIPKVAIYSDEVIVKDVYSMVTRQLLHHIKNHGYDNVFVVGVNTDCCVLKTVLDLFEYNIRPIILADYCGSTMGYKIHDNSIEILGALIGEHNIIYGELDQKYLDNFNI